MRDSLTHVGQHSYKKLDTGDISLSADYNVQTINQSVPSLQMPQPPQATQPTNISPELMLSLAVIIAVFLIAAFLYTRRKEQPKVKKTKKAKKMASSERPKVTKADKIETDVTTLSTKMAEGKRVCVECGNGLPAKLKFCDNCGTKQP